MILTTGQKVKLVDKHQLFKILKQRNFCSNDEIRKQIANEIGGAKGIVYSIEAKWQHDYFYFLPDGSLSDLNKRSVPVEAVEFFMESKSLIK